MNVLCLRPTGIILVSARAKTVIQYTTVQLTTQRQWRIDAGLVMNITVPQQAGQHWVSLDASSGRAKRRAKVWLEYLLWLSYLNVDAEKSKTLQRIAVFFRCGL